MDELLLRFTARSEVTKPTTLRATAVLCAVLAATGAASAADAAEPGGPRTCCWDTGCRFCLASELCTALPGCCLDTTAEGGAPDVPIGAARATGLGPPCGSVPCWGALC